MQADPPGLPFSFTAKLWACAAAAAAVGLGIHVLLGSRHAVAAAALVLAPYGGIYFLATSLAGVAEARTFLKSAARTIGLNDY